MSHSLENQAEQRLVMWLNGIKQELKFWDDWFASKGDRWPEEYQRRSQSDARDRPVDPGGYALSASSKGPRCRLWSHDEFG